MQVNWGKFSVMVVVSAIVIGAVFWMIASATFGTVGPFRGSVGRPLLFLITIGPLLTVAGLGGLLVGYSIVVYPVVKEISASISYANKDSAASRITDACIEMGYDIASKSEGALAFNPSAVHSFLSGRITVMLGADSATVTGPTWAIERIQQRFSGAD